MRIKKKRILGILLSLALVLGLMPGMGLTAQAAEITYESTNSIENASSGDTIKLSKNETITATKGNSSNRAIYLKTSITLDGNGYSFTCNGNSKGVGNFFYEQDSSKTFNATNITFITSNCRTFNPRLKGTVFNADSTVAFKGEGSCGWEGGLAEITNAATLNLNGSAVDGVKSKGNGGAFHIKAGSSGGGSVNLNYTGYADHQITNCESGGNGGVAYVNANGKLTITDAVIQGNSANTSGGAIYLAKGGLLTLKGNTVITGNKANGNENNIYLASGATITLDGFTGKAGVTTAVAPAADSPVKIAAGAVAADAARITSDNSDYYVAF